MNCLRLLLVAVAGVPLLIHAQPARVPAAADVNATVAPLQYQSAFAAYRPNPSLEDAPDKIWLQANREVTGESTHGTHGGMPLSMNSAPASTTKPQTVPAADPHGQHHLHKKGQ